MTTKKGPQSGLSDVIKCPSCSEEIKADANHCRFCKQWFCIVCRGHIFMGNRHYLCKSAACEIAGKVYCATCARRAGNMWGVWVGPCPRCGGKVIEDRNGELMEVKG